MATMVTTPGERCFLEIGIPTYNRWEKLKRLLSVLLGIHLTKVAPTGSVCLGVEDYPRGLAELEARFSTEEACRVYLHDLRWPDGFHCPKCGQRKAWPVGVRLLQCAACGRQRSVTAGTILQDNGTPLPTWFRAMWWVTNQKTGASAPRTAAGSWTRKLPDGVGLVA
jgi:Transposase zinc-ribbon domain